MKKDNSGVWSVEVSGDIKNTYYTYSVDGAVNNDDNNNDNNNDDSSSSFDNKAIMLVLLAMIASGSASFVAYRKKDM
ncbi:MAG: hypothetical protein PUD42_02210 [Clostridiales bacterium]|nr:hypothetical protein [Clostridiales bacterium]